MPDDEQRALGQYFTPGSVIDFALEALARLSHEGEVGVHERRLVDPACGDGGFLRRALDKALVAPCNAYGIDKDHALCDVWSESGIRGPDGPWLDVGDGLLADTICGKPVGSETFDWVVGNPPYAGRGLKEADDETLERIADEYELCRLRFRRLPPGPEQIRRIPVEVLFVERFCKLCRPGGCIAIILPVGIFANARWRFVREWLLQRVTLHVVVGLPRATFRAGAITAKTCLAIARKAEAGPSREVLFAEANHIGLKGGKNELTDILRLWMEGGEAAASTRPWEL